MGLGYISELERGLVVPTVHALAKVAAALEVTVADLVLGDSVREQIFAATRGVTDGELGPILEKLLKMRCPGGVAGRYGGGRTQKSVRCRTSRIPSLPRRA